MIFTPPFLGSLTPFPTFRILTEAGENLADENGNPLRQE